MTPRRRVWLDETQSPTEAPSCDPSGTAGFPRFPPEVIFVGGVLALALRVVRPGSGGVARRAWHRGRPRTLYRWVQQFTPLLIDAARPCRHLAGGRCSDHARLKARLRWLRGLKAHRTASVVIRGHAFIQNLRRGHYERAIDASRVFGLATALDELKRPSDHHRPLIPPHHAPPSNNATEPPELARPTQRGSAFGRQ